MNKFLNYMRTTENCYKTYTKKKKIIIELKISIIK